MNKRKRLHYAAMGKAFRDIRVDLSRRSIHSIYFEKKKKGANINSLLTHLKMVEVTSKDKSLMACDSVLSISGILTKTGYWCWKRDEATVVVNRRDEMLARVLLSSM